MTELDKLKILSALKLGYGKLTAKNTTEKEFENIEQAIEIVKKLTIPVVVGQSEQLVCSCGSIKVQTTGGSQCPNNRCSSAN